MAEKSLAEFIELVKEDTSLQAELRKTNSADGLVAKAVTLGHERGYTFTEEEVHTVLKVRQKMGQLNTKELDEISGADEADDWMTISLACRHGTF